MATEISTAILRVCADLGLPPGDSYTQNWAYELPEKYRSEAAFYRYLEAYSSPTYGDPERLLLMQLMLDMTNDFISQDEAVGQRMWNGIRNVLRQSPELHRDQIEYWAANGDPLEDAFSLTPLARELNHELYDEKVSSGEPKES